LAATIFRPARFEAGVDLADDVLGHGVGLDDRKGAFDRHEKFS
jgi:hypothetical protein